jgi:protein SCO1/2
MRNFAPRRVAFAFLLCLAAASLGCGRSDKVEAGARQYEARGIVRGIAPDHSTLDIEHEAIPGFMPSMTMPFTAKDPKESAALRIGDAISFRLSVTDRNSWIDQIKKIQPADVQLPVRKTEATVTVAASTRLRGGDTMPSFELTDQNGQTITLDSFLGRPFVLTFIFTRCPIPNFCPLMGRHFAELQKAIKGGAGSLSETRLLSISFDPENDTPAVLKEYAQHEGADSIIWTFATGAKQQIKELTGRFSVLVEPEAGTISHGLATALIDPNGRIVEIWRGNGWKPEEVIAKIVPLATQPSARR